jgi:hypothetical protein
MDEQAPASLCPFPETASPGLGRISQPGYSSHPWRPELGLEKETQGRSRSSQRGDSPQGEEGLGVSWGALLPWSLGCTHPGRRGEQGPVPGAFMPFPWWHRLEALPNLPHSSFVLPPSCTTRVSHCAQWLESPVCFLE